jgi:hypothetical protein
VTASSAIEQLLDTGFTRIRLKLRLADMFLQDVGRAWLNTTLTYRTAPQVYRITNSQGLEKYFRLSVGSNENGQKMATITNLHPNGSVKSKQNRRRSPSLTAA